MSQENQSTVNFTFKEAGKKVNGTAMLTLEGSLDADAAPILADELERRLVEGEKQVHLDLAGVGFISSSGIGSLIAAIGEYRDEGGDLILHRMSKELLHVFEMLGLLDYVNHQP